MPILGVNAVSAQRFWQLPDGLRAALAERIPEGWSLEVCADAGSLGSLVRRSEVVLGWPFPSALARRAERLRWVHFFTAGVPESWRDIQGIELTTSVGLTAGSVAEHGLFLALAGLRGAVAGGFRSWDPDTMAVARVPGEMQALVVGYGAVGRELCRRLAPLFASVRALSRTGRMGEAVEVWPFERAGQAFFEADLVALAVPLSAESRALLSPARFFAALRPGALIVNVARGELVDEEALLRFLEANPESRYLADVAHPEPYADHLPLWRSQQVLLTPHVAGRRADAWDRIGARALELVSERLRSPA